MHTTEQDSGQHTTLSEPRVLSSPGVTGGIRLQVLIIVLIFFVGPGFFALWSWQPQISDLYSPVMGVIIGIVVGIALELLHMSGWIRFGFGSVLLDESRLVVPNLIGKKVYSPDQSQIWVSQQGGDAYTVLIVGNRGTKSLLYVNEDAVGDLHRWLDTDQLAKVHE